MQQLHFNNEAQRGMLGLATGRRGAMGRHWPPHALHHTCYYLHESRVKVIHVQAVCMALSSAESWGTRLCNSLPFGIS